MAVYSLTILLLHLPWSELCEEQGEVGGSHSQQQGAGGVQEHHPGLLQDKVVEKILAISELWLQGCW